MRESKEGIEYELSANSICSAANRAHAVNIITWYPNSCHNSILEAFEDVVLSKFHSPYQAAYAIENFLDTLRRAQAGKLKPVHEIRAINPDATEPEIVFEIKYNWNDIERGKTAGFVGARLFHIEPKELPNTVAAMWMMVKMDEHDDDLTFIKQTSAAKQAAFKADECRRRGWDSLIQEDFSKWES